MNSITLAFVLLFGPVEPSYPALHVAPAATRATVEYVAKATGLMGTEEVGSEEYFDGVVYVLRQRASGVWRIRQLQPNDPPSRDNPAQ